MTITWKKKKKLKVDMNAMDIGFVQVHKNKYGAIEEEDEDDECQECRPPWDF